jgi:hypothetical protein
MQSLLAAVASDNPWASFDAPEEAFPPETPAFSIAPKGALLHCHGFIRDESRRQTGVLMTLQNLITSFGSFKSEPKAQTLHSGLAFETFRCDCISG